MVFFWNLFWKESTSSRGQSNGRCIICLSLFCAGFITGGQAASHFQRRMIGFLIISDPWPCFHPPQLLHLQRPPLNLEQIHHNQSLYICLCPMMFLLFLFQNTVLCNGVASWLNNAIMHPYRKLAHSERKWYTSGGLNRCRSVLLHELFSHLAIGSLHLATHQGTHYIKDVPVWIRHRTDNGTVDLIPTEAIHTENVWLSIECTWNSDANTPSCQKGDKNQRTHQRSHYS